MLWSLWIVYLALPPSTDDHVYTDLYGLHQSILRYGGYRTVRLTAAAIYFSRTAFLHTLTICYTVPLPTCLTWPG